MIEALVFSDSDRTFTCSIEERTVPRPEAWWWFRVSTDRQHRYAPFRAAATDTPASVQSRIVAYYENLLTRRALPSVRHWAGRPTTPATVGATTPTTS